MAIGSTGASGGLSSLNIFLSAKATTEARAERIQQDPRLQQRITDFTERVRDIETIEELTTDRRALSFVLDAFGLGTEVNKQALVRRAIEEGPEGFAFFLNDVRYREMAAFFDAPKNGVSQLKSETGKAALVKRFQTQSGEQAIGQQSDRARQALFFQRIASTIDSPLELLGNNLTRDIVVTALNLPPQIALQSVDKQVSLIEKGIDVDQLDDPEYLDQFLTRFLINADIVDSGASATGGARLYSNQQIAAQLQRNNASSGLLNFLA